MELDKTELEIFKEFIDRFGDVMSNAGSNDYMWPESFSKEKRMQIIRDYHTKNGDIDEINVEADADYPATYDWLIWDYLVNKLLTPDPMIENIKAMYMSMLDEKFARCQCEYPHIICDNRGCRCETCGKLQ